LALRSNAVLNYASALRIIRMIFLSVDGLTPFGGLRGLDIAYVDVAITASGLNLR
jgi:hypothetical protein